MYTNVDSLRSLENSSNNNSFWLVDFPSNASLSLLTVLTLVHLHLQDSHVATVWRVPEVAKRPRESLQRGSWKLELQPEPQSTLQVWISNRCFPALFSWKTGTIFGRCLHEWMQKLVHVQLCHDQIYYSSVTLVWLGKINYLRTFYYGRPLLL